MQKQASFSNEYMTQKVLWHAASFSSEHAALLYPSDWAIRAASDISIPSIWMHEKFMAKIAYGAEVSFKQVLVRTDYAQLAYHRSDGLCLVSEDLINLIQFIKRLTCTLTRLSLGTRMSGNRPSAIWKSFHVFPLPGSKVPPS